MRLVRLMDTTLEVSALCLGLGGFGTGIKDEAADRLLAAFLEGGGNFVDTAHCYSFWEPNGLGASERELGACLRRLGVREKVVIGTKGGHPAIEPGYSRPDAYLAPEVIAQDVDESLERLGFAFVDLYYLHRDDTRVPVGEIVDTLHQEVDRGRIRYLGASNWSVERLEAANAHAQSKGRQGFIASQVQWSLATPTWKIGLDPTTRYVTEDDVRWHTRTRLPIVAYSATASGYFSDTPRNPGLYDDPANPGRAERARTLAAQRKATPTQIALAYLACQSVPTIPLFSTANLAHLAEALDSIALTLSLEELTWLRDG